MEKQQKLDKRIRQPSNQFWGPCEMASRSWEFSSLWPFSKVIEVAPPMHTIVPIILAMVLSFFKLISSNLMFACS